MSWLSGLSWLFGLQYCLTPGLALAEPATTRLAWQAAPGCISAAEVQRGVEQRLGRSVFAAPADLVLRGKLGPGADGVMAQLELRTTAVAPGQRGVLVGSREFRMPGADCRQLDDALLLVASLMLDVPREELPPPPPVRATPERSATTAVERPRPVAPMGTPLRLPRPPALDRAWGYAVYGAGTVGAGAAPPPSLGAQLGVLLTPPSFWMIDTGLVYEHGKTRSAGPGLRLDTLLWGVAACPVHAALELCVLQRVGVAWADGVGLDQQRSSMRIRAEVGVALRYAVAVARPLSLVFGLEGVAPLVQDRYVYERGAGSQGEVFRVAPVAGSLSLGLRLAL